MRVLRHGGFCEMVVSCSDMGVNFFRKFQVYFCFFSDWNFLYFLFLLYFFPEVFVMLDVLLCKHCILGIFFLFHPFILVLSLFNFLYISLLLGIPLFLSESFQLLLFLFLEHFQSFLSFFIPFIALMFKSASFFIINPKYLVDSCLLLLLFLSL